MSSDSESEFGIRRVPSATARLRELLMHHDVHVSDKVRDIIRVLKRAADSRTPVLIENADILMPSFLLALELEPDLWPEEEHGTLAASALRARRKSVIGEEAFTDMEHGGYRIFLTTQVVSFLPPAHAMFRISVVNWEADVTCMDSITMDAVRRVLRV